jgi:hypothetical protein
MRTHEVKRTGKTLLAAAIVTLMLSQHIAHAQAGISLGEALDSSGFLRPYAVTAMYNGNPGYFLSGGSAEIAARIAYLLAFANLLNGQCGLLSQAQVQGLNILHLTYIVGSSILASRETLEVIARESAVGVGDSLLFVGRYSCDSRTARQLAQRLY